MSHTAAIVDAVAYAAQHLLSSGGYATHIEAVLARLGAAADVSRVYVFHNHTNDLNDLLTSQDYEWAADGIEPNVAILFCRIFRTPPMALGTGAALWNTASLSWARSLHCLSRSVRC